MITVTTSIQKSLANVWEKWTAPQHIMQWNFATPEWHCPKAENDLRAGGRFSARMEAKDGSAGFDFSGRYEAIKKFEWIRFTMDDGRKAEVHFSEKNGTTTITESFEPEGNNSAEMQQQGWQAILDQFKNYAEKHG